MNGKEGTVNGLSCVGNGYAIILKFTFKSFKSTSVKKKRLKFKLCLKLLRNKIKVKKCNFIF